MKDYVKRLRNISVADTAEVGVKNAFLGEIFTHLALSDIRVPDGFAITVSAYRRFIEYNKLDGVHEKLLAEIDTQKYSNIAQIGQEARDLITGGRMPGDIYDIISAFYRELCADSNPEVAVRSSPVSPDPFYIGTKDKHDTFLNIKGEKALIESVKKCFASLYSDKSIMESPLNMDRTISVCVQRMIRSDKSCSGFAYTADPLSGFMDVIHVSGVWGLGEKIIEERISPDEFIVYKPTLPEGIKSIIQKKMGSKSRMVIYQEGDVEGQVVESDTPLKQRDMYVLNDEEILTLANWGMTLEKYYSSPVSMEWAKDGLSHELYLLHAKPKNFKKEHSGNK